MAGLGAVTRAFAKMLYGDLGSGCNHRAAQCFRDAAAQEPLKLIHKVRLPLCASLYTLSLPLSLPHCLPLRLPHCVSLCLLSPTLCVSPCLPHRALPRCLSHCVSHCLPLFLPLCHPLRLHHRVSHCVSHRVSHRVSHCVSHCTSLTGPRTASLLHQVCLAKCLLKTGQKEEAKAQLLMAMKLKVDDVNALCERKDGVELLRKVRDKRARARWAWLGSVRASSASQKKRFAGYISGKACHPRTTRG
jgi:hypothetical protein